MRKSPLKFRELSKEFMKDLIETNGFLHPLLEEVKRDSRLMLAIRDECINIYYRGGSILRVKRQGSGSYTAEFAETSYNIKQRTYPKVPSNIENQNHSKDWVNAFETLEEIMDDYFKKYPKAEKEFQQLLVRNNNNSTDSEYFITDIEYQEFAKGPRIDMLALHWLESSQGSTCNLRPVVIEIKCGDGSLEGDTGIIGHLKDFNDIIIDETRRDTLFRTIKSQFKQLGELGLIDRDSRFFKCNPLEINLDTKPEVIFILADHDSTDGKLGKELAKLENSENIDLKFDLSSSLNYSLRSDKMISLKDLKERVTIDEAKK